MDLESDYGAGSMCIIKIKLILSNVQNLECVFDSRMQYYLQVRLNLFTYAINFIFENCSTYQNVFLINCK